MLTERDFQKGVLLFQKRENNTPVSKVELNAIAAIFGI